MTNEEALEILKSIEILSFRDVKRKYFMSDVWKAQKVAIKALEQQPSKDCVSRESVLMELGKYLCGVPFDEKGIDKVIKELPSVTPQTRWVPVSERLPEKNIEVLITTKWDCITIGEMFGDNDWFIHEGTTYAANDNIKAWMPLPEPYKESEE